MLLRLTDFVDKFLVCGLIFATYKCNYVFFQKKLFLVRTSVGIMLLLTPLPFIPITRDHTIKIPKSVCLCLCLAVCVCVCVCVRACVCGN